MHRLFEVDRIEGADVISRSNQQLAGLDDQGALRICDHDGRTLGFCALHDVGLDEKPGFTGAGAADHKHVLVACVTGILGTVAQGQAFRFRQDHIVPWIWINKRHDIRVRTPAGGAVLFIAPIFFRVPAFLIDQQTQHAADHQTDQKIGWIKARQRGLKGGGEAVHQVEKFLGDVSTLG